MFELKFSPVVIKHLGLSMYSTLPPVLAELITNSYDADASIVIITINQIDKSIEVLDNGCGMTDKELNDDFLNVGRNRREKDTANKTVKFQRKVTGKKGIGKLSVFGICTEIYVESCKNNHINAFTMNYDEIINRPDNQPLNLIPDISNQKTDKKSYTKIILKNLIRKSNIDVEATRNSIVTRLNIFDQKFKCLIRDEKIKKRLTLQERTKLIESDLQFCWNLPQDFINLKIDSQTTEYFKKNKIYGRVITTTETIRESFKGITLYARGKLANNPEFYGVKLSNSHAFSYMSGEIHVDFMDEDNKQDLISTARNSLIWENEEAKILQSHLQNIINKIGTDWREKRKEKREKEMTSIYNIDITWYQSKIQSGPDQQLAKKITDLVVNSDLEILKTKDLIEYVQGAFEFEVFRSYARTLDTTANSNSEELLKLLQDWEVIEAKEHYRLSIGRVETIEKFDNLISNNTLEVAKKGIETMHSFLNKFPWILEPRLSSFSDEVTYRNFLLTEFNDHSKLEEDRRIDFICKGGSDTLYILEIKRSQLIIGEKELSQLKAYQRFIEAKLEENDRSYTTVKAYIIGKESSSDIFVKKEIKEAMQHNRFVLTYNQMLSQAKKYHEDFIDAYEKTNNLKQIKSSN